MSKTHPLIPVGDFCYRVERLAPGEVLSRDLDRYGKDLREYSFSLAHRTKAVLCPYWQVTGHGTVRCEHLNREVLDEERDYALSLDKANKHFGADRVHEMVGRSWALADEIKICGVNEDDEDEDAEGETSS